MPPPPLSPPSSIHSPTDADSAPPSPATSMTSTQTDTDTTTMQAAETSLDDIFGSSPPHTAAAWRPHATAVPHANGAGEEWDGERETATDFHATAETEPSDLPSLRRQHVTAGYRDGIAYAKGQHVQRGFDAGFPVGAQLGMRVGTVLGILEGVLRGLETRPASSTSVAGAVKVKRQQSQPRGAAVAAEPEEAVEARRRKWEQVKSLYLAAVKELSVEAVFGGVDGPAAADDGSDEKPETRLGRKGDAVVSKWEKRVMVPSWEENMDPLVEEVQAEQS